MLFCLVKIRFAHQVDILFYKFQSNVLIYNIELLFLSLAKLSGNCSKSNNDDLIKTGPFQAKIILILILGHLPPQLIQAEIVRHQFCMTFLFLTGIFCFTL